MNDIINNQTEDSQKTVSEKNSNPYQNVTMKELFLALDEDVKELLSIIHNIKMGAMAQNFDKSKVERALLLTNKIQAELYQLAERPKETEETERIFIVRILHDPYVFPHLEYIHLRARNKEEAIKRIKTELCPTEDRCIVIDAYEKPNES